MTTGAADGGAAAWLVVCAPAARGAVSTNNSREGANNAGKRLIIGRTGVAELNFRFYRILDVKKGRKALRELPSGLEFAGGAVRQLAGIEVDLDVPGVQVPA